MVKRLLAADNFGVADPADPLVPFVNFLLGKPLHERSATEAGAPSMLVFLALLGVAILPGANMASPSPRMCRAPLPVECISSSPILLVVLPIITLHVVGVRLPVLGFPLPDLVALKCRVNPDAGLGLLTTLDIPHGIVSSLRLRITVWHQNPHSRQAPERLRTRLMATPPAHTTRPAAATPPRSPARRRRGRAAGPQGRAFASSTSRRTSSCSAICHRRFHSSATQP